MIGPLKNISKRALWTCSLNGRINIEGEKGARLGSKAGNCRNISSNSFFFWSSCSWEKMNIYLSLKPEEPSLSLSLDSLNWTLGTWYGKLVLYFSWHILIKRGIALTNLAKSSKISLFLGRRTWSEVVDLGYQDNEYRKKEVEAGFRRIRTNARKTTKRARSRLSTS